MALANGVRIVWLDTHIGRDGEYQEFKNRFHNTLEEVALVPPDAINVLIWTLEQNGAPFLFANTPAQAATLIETHHDKQIIFISSGSLGQYMIPFISGFYSHVYRFYIFCVDIAKYVEFGLDYASCLQMFVHETDLLVRLTRDISSDIIKQGELYMQLPEPENALKCYDHAITLNVRANELDNSDEPFLVHIRQLCGHGNSVGLIQEAKDVLNQGQ